jgi:hypothetical protein
MMTRPTISKTLEKGHLDKVTKLHQKLQIKTDFQTLKVTGKDPIPRKMRFQSYDQSYDKFQDHAAGKLRVARKHKFTKPEKFTKPRFTRTGNCI